MFVRADNWKHRICPAVDEIKHGLLLRVLRFLICEMGPVSAAYFMPFHEDEVRAVPGKLSTVNKLLVVVAAVHGIRCSCYKE